MPLHLLPISTTTDNIICLSLIKCDKNHKSSYIYKNWTSKLRWWWSSHIIITLSSVCSIYTAEMIDGYKARTSLLPQEKNSAICTNILSIILSLSNISTSNLEVQNILFSLKSLNKYNISVVIHLDEEVKWAVSGLETYKIDTKTFLTRRQTTAANLAL